MDVKGRNMLRVVAAVFTFLPLICINTPVDQPIDCFDVHALSKQMKPLKAKCPEPFDYETCCEYYECAARFYNAWDDTCTPPGVKFTVLREKMLEAALKGYEDKVACWIDDCHKNDSTCGIEFNKCFGECIKQNCPKLMKFVPDPPDCSKDSDEKKK